MGDTDELLAWLRQKHQEMPAPEAGSFYSNAADELMRLEGRLADVAASWRARAVRAEADADRLTAEVMRLMCACERSSGYRCTKCVTLDLHDKEVEAR